MDGHVAVLSRDALLPRRREGIGRGLALAVVAHVLLVVALSISVDWHSSASPDAVDAELWAAVPRAAAPRAAEPNPQPVTPPPPTPAPQPAPPPRPAPAPPKPVEPPPVAKVLPDAEIGIERRKQQQRREQEQEAEAEARHQATIAAQAKKLALAKAASAAADRLARQQAADVAAVAKAREERQRAEAERREQADARKRIEAQDKRLQAQREANLKRIVGEAGGSGTPTSTGTAARSAGPSGDYIGRIKSRIRPNVSFPNILDGNPAVEVEVRLAPDGRIISSRVVKASGAPEWDAAVLRAIDKTEVLPRDETGRVPPVMTIVYRPRDV